MRNSASLIRDSGSWPALTASSSGSQKRQETCETPYGLAAFLVSDGSDLLPEGLEGEEVVLSVRATSAAELRRRVAAAAAAVTGTAVDEIYRVLGGEW